MQVQAAQKFKELSDKVTNARGDSRGKRSPKGQAAITAARRAARVGARERSKSPPPSSSDGNGRSSATPLTGHNGGGHDGDRGSSRARTSIGSNGRGSEFSSQHRQVSRGGSGNDSRSSRISISSSSSGNKRSAKTDVFESAGEERRGKRDQEQTRRPLSSSLIVASNPERSSVEVVVPDVGQPDQRQERAGLLKGTSAEEVEMPDASDDAGLLGDRQQVDYAEVQQQLWANNNAESVTNIDGTQSDGTGVPRVAEPNQMLDVAEADQQGDVPEAEEARSKAKTASADEAEAPIASPPLQGTSVTPKTTEPRHKDEKNPPVSSRASQDESGQAPLRQQEAKQREQEQAQAQVQKHEQKQGEATEEEDRQSDYAVVETKTEATPAPMTAGKQDMSDERNKISSWVEGRQEAGIVEKSEEPRVVSLPGQTMDDGEVGGLGPETEDQNPASAAAVIEFVPTEGSLAAYSQVTKKLR